MVYLIVIDVPIQARFSKTAIARTIEVGFGLGGGRGLQMRNTYGSFCAQGEARRGGNIMAKEMRKVKKGAIRHRKAPGSGSTAQPGFARQRRVLTTPSPIPTVHH